jgi:hypothetical protein
LRHRIVVNRHVTVVLLVIEHLPRHAPWSADCFAVRFYYCVENVLHVAIPILN